MPETQSSATFTWASGSATASGTTNPITTTGLYAKTVYIAIAQVGVPTTGATFTINQSPDGTTYYAGPTYSPGLLTAFPPWIIMLDPTCAAVTITWTAQAGGVSSTLTAQLGEVTGI